MSRYDILGYDDDWNCFDSMKEVESIRLIERNQIATPEITVFIPTYKRYELFRQALQSVLRQTPIDVSWDILILDNEPYDGQSNQIEEYIKEISDVPISYYRNTQNMDPADNFNRGFLLAKGNWVMMLHDDDLLAANALKRMWTLTSAYSQVKGKEIGAICALYIQFTDDSKENLVRLFQQIESPAIDYKVYKLTHHNVLFTGRIGGAVPTNGSIYNKKAVIDVGGFNKKYHLVGDMVLLYRLERKYVVYSALSPTGLYRCNNNSYSDQKKIQEIIEETNYLRNYISKKSIFTRIYSQCLKKGFDKIYEDSILRNTNDILSEYEQFDEKKLVSPKKIQYFLAKKILKLYSKYKSRQTDVLLKRIGKFEKRKKEKLLTRITIVKKFTKAKDIIRLLPNRFTALENKLDAIDRKNEMMFWYTLNYLSKEKCGTLLETQQKFYSVLPPDNGNIHNIQLIMKDIIREFVQVCNQNNLSYWVWGGTLLGFVRHNGFIPWDDDSDIGMPRDSFDKFVEIIQESDKLKLDYYYVIGPGDGPARIPKLRRKGTQIPVYIDIFPFDPSEHTTHANARKEYIEIRTNLAKDINEISKRIPIGRYNSERIDNYRKRMALEGAFNRAAHSCSEGNYYRWGADLFWAPIGWMPKEWIFPLKKVVFEGIEVNIPNKAEDCLQMVYGDYYRFPKDIYGNFHSKWFGFDAYEDEITEYIKNYL